MTTDKNIRRHTAWLYAVIVGLAIQQAFVTLVPHLINPGVTAELIQSNPSFHFPHPQVSVYPEVLRIIVFLVLIVRFYLGSTFFFSIAYERSDSDILFPTKNYATDFVFGLLHFLSFLILALTIDLHSTPPHTFVYLVGFVLFYDLFWFMFSFRQSTSRLIFWWMLINVLTALVSAMIYLVIWEMFRDPFKAETYALWLVIMVSLMDLGLMMTRRPFFRPLGRAVGFESWDEASEHDDDDYDRNPRNTSPLT